MNKPLTEKEIQARETVERLTSKQRLTPEQVEEYQRYCLRNIAKYMMAYDKLNDDCSPNLMLPWDISDQRTKDAYSRRAENVMLSRGL